MVNKNDREQNEIRAAGLARITTLSLSVVFLYFWTDYCNSFDSILQKTMAKMIA